MPLTGFFIAGTDNGVGKTEVARALLMGMPGAVPLKPVETGCAPDPHDALALLSACGRDLPLDRVCPHRFALPAAPLAAAEAEGREVSMARIFEQAGRAAVEGAPLVVEAAGGLLVPLARERGELVTNIDFARSLRLPVVLVARAGLGTINHTALSIEALARRGIAVAAVVLNRTSRDDDASVAGNAHWIEELTGARVLGPTPFVADAAARPRALLDALTPLLPATRVRAP